MGSNAKAKFVSARPLMGVYLSRADRFERRRELDAGDRHGP